MTTPRPPSIITNVTAPPLVPLHHSDSLVYIVGPPGTGALPAYAANERPSAIATSLAALEEFIGADGAVHDAVEAIFDQVDTNIAVARTPAAPTHQQVIDTLDKVRLLTDVPTHLYAPGRTGDGVVAGQLDADIDDAVTAFTFDAAPTSAISVGELLLIESEIVRVAAPLPGAGVHTYDIERAQEGTDAAAHAAAVDIVDIRNPVTAELELLAEELECVAVADGDNTSIDRFVAWLDAGNARPNVMGLFNEPDGRNPGGPWLGAVLDRQAEFGRQRGVNHARVGGVTDLAHELTHSPRANVDTDVSRIVAAYGSLLLRRHGHVEIVGDQFKGIDDARTYWSVTLVVNHLRRISEEAVEPFIGIDADLSTVVRIAAHVERAGRQLVRPPATGQDGAGARRGELRSLTIVPHATKNTAEARANGRIFLRSVAGVFAPIRTVEFDLELQIKSKEATSHAIRRSPSLGLHHPGRRLPGHRRDRQRRRPHR